MSDTGARSRRPRPPVGPGSHDALRVTFVVVWSVLVWVALWGDLSIANVVWGAVLGGLTVALVPVRHMAHRVPIRPWQIVRFIGVFLGALVKASAVVAWEVVSPTNRINEAIVAVDLRTTSPGLMTLIGNMVSLTPGTLTLEVRRDPPTLYIHVLHLRGIEEVRDGVRHFEDVALAAFGEISGGDDPREETG